MFTRDFIRKVIGYNLLILFTASYISITFFSHTHHLDNGILIVHSHPFKSGTGKIPYNHQHSPNSYILIHSLNNALSAALVIFFSLALTGSLPIIINQIFKELISVKFREFSYSLRAPPVLYKAVQAN